MADIVFTPRHHNAAVPHRRLVPRKTGKSRLAVLGFCAAIWAGVAFIAFQYAPPF
jgi:hypothetical protein